MTRDTLYRGPAVTVTFKDHGQDFIEWDIAEGKVVACRPFQAAVWCGTEIHCTPKPREQLRITGHDGKLTYVKFPLARVRAMPAKASKLTTAVLNSQVVTKGALALLARMEGSKL